MFPNSRAHAALLALAIGIVVICACDSLAGESSPAAISTTTNKPAPAIFVANPTLNSLSVFPVDGNGNVPSLFTRTFLAQPHGIAYSRGNLYVTNTSDYSVTVYPVSEGRRPNPIVTIAGGKTQMAIPNGVALDSNGNIYVANEGVVDSDPPSVTIYRADSNGDVAPTARISGTKTGLMSPSAIAVDSRGYIYVTNNSDSQNKPDSVTVYAPGSNGDAVPARVIAGPATLLSTPDGVAVDSSGNTFVTSKQSEGPYCCHAAVLIYGPGAAGNVAPIGSIDGDCAKLTMSGGIALGPGGNIYVTNPGDLGPRGVVVFPQQEVRTTYRGQCLMPTVSIGGDQTRISQPWGIAVDPAGNIYVTNEDSDSIGVFQASLNGNVAPSVTIESPTSISSPSAVAIDSKGQIYVANGGGQDNPPTGSNIITIYPPGSYANVKELAIISGDGLNDKPGISFPEAIAVDARGRIYVADNDGIINNGRVAVFAAGSQGNVAPIAIITGPPKSDKTGVNSPVGLGFDSASNLYVLNQNGGPDHQGSITVYPPDSNGNVAPTAVIANGPKDKLTQFHSPAGMALDSAGNIYVTNNSNDTVTVYAAGKFGDVAPIKILSGPQTGLNLPHGIGVDADGKIYVANDASDNKAVDTVTVYAHASNGDTPPTATISGPLTGLGKPAGLAVGP